GGGGQGEGGGARLGPGAHEGLDHRRPAGAAGTNSRGERRGGARGGPPLARQAPLGHRVSGQGCKQSRGPLMTLPTRRTPCCCLPPLPPAPFPIPAPPPPPPPT